MAAARKLKEECGLEALAVEEVGTFDVILEMCEADAPSHGITTLFHMRVSGGDVVRLDDQSEAVAWRTPQEWICGELHDFVLSQVMVFARRRS